MPTLYLVAAPIGDVLSDLAIDGLRLLRTVPTIVLEAEDGFSARLRKKGVLGPQQEVLSLEDPEPTIARALEVLDGGGDVVLTASSGVPCFVDPGAELVDAVLRTRLDRVELVPVGLSSALDAGLALAGQSLDAFTFGGHYPEHHLLGPALLASPLPLVFYVRGPALGRFVRRVRGESAAPPWRMLLLKDVRKKGLSKVILLGADDPAPADGGAHEDWVAVVLSREAPHLGMRSGD